MNFNSWVFPAPKPSYTSELLGNELIWIHNYKNSNNPNFISNSTKKTNGFIKKNDDIQSKITEQSPEEEIMENSMPRYMTPQASITKKFNFNSYNKKYCNNESTYCPPMKSKNNSNKAGLLENNRSYENYEENDDLRPKNVKQYYTRTLDQMNVFNKYSSKTQETNNLSAFHQNNSNNNFNDDVLNATYIPCLLLEYPSNPNPEYIVLFFHGNGEDIFLSYELIDSIRQILKVRIFAPEYPTYGVYINKDCSAERILSDAENCYNYLIHVIGYSEDHIIIIGRSIGTGPASWLAANKNPGALILLSAFTSLQGVVQNYAGSIKHLLKERFVNIDNMKKVNCPTLLIHGMKDKLIPYVHSLKLHDVCKGPCELLLPKEMSHFEFDFEDDMSFPILVFLQKWGFGLRKVLHTNADQQTPNVFPIDVFFKPYI